ncbi:MAG: aldo/keto reductase [Paracoccaceae bacterium]|nr:aldo/keto reductase [Paracoccaceae bacterium]
MQFGGGADENESAAMYAACRDAGINFFDTAYGYTEGRSETILGKLVAKERDDIFIATKCAYEGASPQDIHAQIGESLKRLNVSVIDLLYLHRWDPEVPIEASLEALAGHVASGAVRHLGVSNFAAWQVMKARHAAADLGVEIRVLQPMYNLVKRQVEVEILPMAQSEGLAVCPYSPLGGGLLTGKYASGGSGRLLADDRYAVRYGMDWMQEAARGLSDLGKELDVAASTLAVAWVARHPGIRGPIISARTAEQLAPSLAAMDFKMDDALYERISTLSPTPPPATDRSEEA